MASAHTKICSSVNGGNGFSIPLPSLFSKKLRQRCAVRQSAQTVHERCFDEFPVFAAGVANFARISAAVAIVEPALAAGPQSWPIQKHFGDGIGITGGAGRAIEMEAFSLKLGQMSQVIGMPDNTAIILLCHKHIPADPTKYFDNERLALLNATRQQKLAELTSQKLRQLRQEAAPRNLLPHSIVD
jgi:hypothetical protein